MSIFYITNVLLISVTFLVTAEIIYPGPGLLEVPWILPRAIGQQCWPNNVVPYIIMEPEGFPYSDEQMAAVVKAINTFNDFTCLKFVNVDETPLETKEYLVFNKTVEGWCRISQLRNVSSGVKYVVITVHPGCLRYRTEHMIMHALGFTHEHQRSDRNCFVNVHPNHLEHEKYKMIPHPRWVERYPYDKYSAMHYPSNYRLKSNIVTTVLMRTYRLNRKIFKDFVQPVGNELGTLTRLDIHKVKYKFCKGPHFCYEQQHSALCVHARFFKENQNCTPWSTTDRENTLPPY